MLLLVAPPAAVGGRLQQVGVGVLQHGAEALVLGRHRQRGDGVATQQLVVRGVQEAVAVVGGREAVLLETPLAGVVRIRRHRAVGTCDGHYLLRLCLNS